VSFDRRFFGLGKSAGSPEPIIGSILVAIRPVTHIFFRNRFITSRQGFDIGVCPFQYDRTFRRDELFAAVNLGPFIEAPFPGIGTLLAEGTFTLHGVGIVELGVPGRTTEQHPHLQVLFVFELFIVGDQEMFFGHLVVIEAIGIDFRIRTPFVAFGIRVDFIEATELAPFI